MIETVSAAPLATNARPPEESTITPLMAAAPTAMVAMTALVTVSMTDTELSAELVT